MARHTPLDDSHAPFKRLRKLGPGPRDRAPISEKKHWECNKIEGAKYRQLCTWVGPAKMGHRKGAVKVVIVNKAWKKEYNAEYAAFRAEKPNKPRVNAAQPNYKYRKPLVVKAYRHAQRRVKKAKK